METLDDWAQPVVDPETRAYVYSLVSAIGGSSAEDDGRYILGDDALACLKDLRRWVKFYDERMNRLDVARCLAEANLVKGDLLEILASWPEDAIEDRLRSKIALACLELLVPLTWPIEIEDDQFTRNHHRHLNYIQLAQVDYKRAIIHHDNARILRTVARIGLPSMAQPRSERSSRDEGIIRLVLYMMRNVAMITQPQHLPSEGDETEISRSVTIDAFHEQDIFHVLLTLSSSMGVEFAMQDVVVLETLFHLMKGVDPRKLLMDEDGLAKSNTAELRGLIQKEKSMLAGYARNAPTRHNRFGTMIWVKRDDDRVSTVSGQDGIVSAQQSFQKMDKTKKWNKPRIRSRNAEEAGQNVFDTPVPLAASARKRLRSFVEEFLDSSFNPLFSHLRKALESEAPRVLGVHSKQHFYLVSWFLQAECARRANIKANRHKKNSTTATQESDESFALVASVLNQETFVLLNRFMQQSQDAKDWHDLNAAMKCFTQILLTVQEMSESSLEEDQEIAENIQSRIFYEQVTHDRIISILRNYKGQGFGYLDACTELAHVFMRMLERYSKQNVSMQVRSRRRARKQRKETALKTTEGDDGIADGNESETEDVQEAQRVTTERKFEFTRFAARFMTQGCVDTFVAFIRYYNDLSVEQLKRAHRFFYRVAFKMDLAVMLFRVDVLHLFNKMIKGPEGLDRDLPTFREWEEFVRQLFRRVTKKVEARPELVVEMLFSKIPGSVYYLENGFEKEMPTRAPRPPAELEVKPGMEKKDQVGVAVSVLVNQQKSDALAWIKKVLSSAEDERRSWELESEARKEAEHRPDGENGQTSPPEEPSKAPSILVTPDNDERRVAMFKDNKLRLLMKLLGFDRLGADDDPNASWTISSELSASELADSLDLVRKFEFDPPTYDDGKSAEDFLRSTAAAARRRRAHYDDDSDGDDGEEDLLLAAGGPTARSKSDALAQLKAKRRRRRHDNVDELDDEERARRAEARRKNDLERRKKVKSELFVHDSDEASDDERDQVFFAREAELRSKTGRDHLVALTKAKVADMGSKKRKAAARPALKSKRKKKTVHSSDLDDSDNQDVVARSSRTPSPGLDALHSALGSEGDEATATDTPLSSQQAVASHGSRRGSSVASSIAGIAAKLTNTDTAMPDAEDEDDAPVVKPARRNVRAGFVIDSDSE